MSQEQYKKMVNEFAKVKGISTNEAGKIIINVVMDYYKSIGKKIN